MGYFTVKLTGGKKNCDFNLFDARQRLTVRKIEKRTKPNVLFSLRKLILNSINSAPHATKILFYRKIKRNGNEYVRM